MTRKIALVWLTFIAMTPVHADLSQEKTPSFAHQAPAGSARHALLELMERVQITHKMLGCLVTHPLAQAFRHPIATLESTVRTQKATQRIQRLVLLEETIAWQLGMLELGQACTVDVRELSQQVSQELDADETPLTLDQIARYSCIALCAGWALLKLNEWATARNESVFALVTNSVQDYFTTAWRRIKQYYTLNKLFKNQLKEVAQLGLGEQNYDTFYSATELLTRQADKRTTSQLLELRSNIVDHAFGHNIKPVLAYNFARYVAGYDSAFFTALHSYYVQADLLVTKGTLVTTVVVPAAVTTIIGYKAIEATINFSYGTGVIIPLTELLKEFRALIDNYYLITQRDARFYGWRAFLLYKLHTYTPRIRAAQREAFKEELKRLELYPDSKDHQLAVINSLALLLKE